jgi:hypothetical protein
MAKSKKSPYSLVDSSFFLKLTLYLIIGSQWVRIQYSSTQIPIPAGLVIGLLFAGHEHFQIDRKIEYAMLLLASFIGFWLPLGLTINL